MEYANIKLVVYKFNVHPKIDTGKKQKSDKEGKFLLYFISRNFINDRKL